MNEMKINVTKPKEDEVTIDADLNELILGGNLTKKVTLGKAEFTLKTLSQMEDDEVTKLTGKNLISSANEKDFLSTALDSKIAILTYAIVELRTPTKVYDFSSKDSKDTLKRILLSTNPLILNKLLFEYLQMAGELSLILTPTEKKT
jgi:hypothetical protein